MIGAGPHRLRAGPGLRPFRLQVSLHRQPGRSCPGRTPTPQNGSRRPCGGTAWIYPGTARSTASKTNGADEGPAPRRSGDQPPIVVDAILVGAGRVPNVEGLNLEAAGVPTTRRASSQRPAADHQPRIYAAGDVCSRFNSRTPPMPWRASSSRTPCSWAGARASALTIPWCTYTDPEVAHVGLRKRGRRQGWRVRTFTQEFADVDRAVLDGEAEGFVKVLVRRRDRPHLGATMVAAHAGDLISESTLAMVGRLGLPRMAGRIHPYPTQAEAIKKLGDAYNRTRLTPWVSGCSSVAGVDPVRGPRRECFACQLPCTGNVVAARAIRQASSSSVASCNWPARRSPRACG